MIWAFCVLSRARFAVYMDVHFEYFVALEKNSIAASKSPSIKSCRSANIEHVWPTVCPQFPPNEFLEFCFFGNVHNDLSLQRGRIIAVCLGIWSEAIVCKKIMIFGFRQSFGFLKTCTVSFCKWSFEADNAWVLLSFVVIVSQTYANCGVFHFVFFLEITEWNMPGVHFHVSFVKTKHLSATYFLRIRKSEVIRIFGTLGAFRNSVHMRHTFWRLTEKAAHDHVYVCFGVRLQTSSLRCGASRQIFQVFLLWEMGRACGLASEEKEEINLKM